MLSWMKGLRPIFIPSNPGLAGSFVPSHGIAGRMGR